MGIDPLTFGLAMGGLSAVSSIGNSIAMGQQQAAAAKAQARALQAQAQQEKILAEKEQQEIERRKIEMRKQYEAVQSQNRTSLAAGNVDMSSGSALDMQVGNANMFAADIGENAYSKAMKQWEAQVNQNIMQSKISNLKAQANDAQYIKPYSLLNAAISGVGGFMGGYQTAGGSISSWFKKADDPGNHTGTTGTSGTGG